MKRLLHTIMPSWLLSAYHRGWALAGALVYRFPSRGMTVIGVTGTNGKSTVVRMIHHVLRSSGITVAALSTIEQVIGDQRTVNPHKGTMPGRGKLQAFLRRACNAGCTVVVLEVTSEGVLQHRHAFVGWNIAVVTNVTPEHIEHHGSFEAYRDEKVRFFREALARGGTAVVNADDSSSPLFVQSVPNAHVRCVSIESQPSSLCRTMIQATNIQDVDEGTEFFVEGKRVVLPLSGTFNVVNALQAIAVADALGVGQKESISALAGMEEVPGRMECVLKEPFLVVVDYAHTPDALEKVYASLHDPGEHRGSRLICVLGATGGIRDRWKRPILGKIAADYCDEIIVTNEDPYDDDPEAIARDVAKGFRQSKMQTPSNEIVMDRRDAIRLALQKANRDDVVIITGKGSEQEMAVKGGVIPWDDRSVVREEWKSIQRNHE